jgi:hypothetical protein
MADVNPDQIPKYLKDLRYPANKKDIIDKATRSEADQRVIEALQRLANEIYESPAEIKRAVSEEKKQ